jgi:hypothetical protein
MVSERAAGFGNRDWVVPSGLRQTPHQDRLDIDLTGEPVVDA